MPTFKPRAILVLLAGVLASCSAADGSSKRSATPRADTSPPAARGANATPVDAAPGAPRDSLTDAADRGRILGAESASVWLVMISDFQCPWCKKWHDETFPTLRKEYVDAGKVRVAYMNYPMQMHANARPAALSAMCAAAQGKFWATHDRLFQMQKVWEKRPNPLPYLDSLAVASGADPARQHACSAAGKLYALIDADYTRAQQQGIQGTPVFFVGGRRIDGAESVRVFRMVIDSVLRAGGK